MKNINEYMQKIRLENSAITKRIIEVAEQVKNVCSEDIEDIFISEYKQEDNTRVFESIWFFTKSYIIEAKNFRLELNLDLVRFQEEYYQIIYSDYDFANATDKSRMTLKIQFGSGIYGLFKATEFNCDVLKDIFNKYVKK